MGGGNLSKGFAISGVLYPILILVVFVIVQMLTMLGTRKMVLDQNRNQLIDSLNSNGKVYTNEELTELITQLQNSTYNKEEVDSLYQNTKKEYEQAIDLRSYNENTWYPVFSKIVSNEGYRRIRCMAFLDDGDKPSWSTHKAGFSMSIDLLSQAGSWGNQPARTIVLANDVLFANVSPVGYYNYSEPSSHVFYLRGGGKYKVYSDYKTHWTLATSKHVFNTQYNIYVEPQSSNPGIKATTSLVTIK